MSRNRGPDRAVYPNKSPTRSDQPGKRPGSSNNPSSSSTATGDAPRKHPIFEREGTEVICEVPVSMVQAALGAEIEVPTLDGPVKMKVPAGTQTGRLFRLRHRGVVSLNGGGRGDQLVGVLVETPGKLTARQKDLLRQFAEASRAETNPIGKGFFEKVKGIFSDGDS